MNPDFTLFSDNLDYALGWMVIHSLWQATLIAIISGILMLVLRKKAAKMRYVVANVALLAVVVSAVVTFCLYYDFAQEPATMTFTATDNVENTEGVAVSAQTPTPEPVAANSLTINGFKDYFNHNIPLIVTIWILGVALFLLKLLGGISYIYYLKNRMNFPADEYWADMLQRLSEKAGLKKGIEIVESAMVRTPMVVGHLKPMILFPMGVINRLTPEEVEAILAHELAHVMRNDFIFNILQSVAEALFYFHPAVWWLSAQISNERESACDDMAIELINSKINYARALVAIQEMAYFPLTPSLAFAGQRKSQFVMRMQRILNQPNNKTNIMEKLISTSALVLLVVGLAFGENLTPDNVKNDPLSISDEKAENTAFNDQENTSENAQLFIFLPGKMDSLKIESPVADGIYRYEDNTQKAEMEVKDNYVIALTVNEIELKPEQFVKYKRLIDKVLRLKKPDNTNRFTEEAMREAGIEMNEDFAENTMREAGISMDKNGIYFNNDEAKFSLDKSGLHLDAHDEKDGSDVTMSLDKNGMKMKSKDFSMNLSPDNNRSKSLRLRTKGGFTYDIFDRKQMWRVHKNGKFLGELQLKDGKMYQNGRELSENELKPFGLKMNKNGNGFDPINDVFQIDNLGKGDCDDCPETDNDCEECYEDFKEKMEDLREKLKDMKEDLRYFTGSSLQKTEFLADITRLNAELKRTQINEQGRVTAQIDRLHERIKNDFERNNQYIFKNGGQNYNNQNKKNDPIRAKIQAELRKDGFLDGKTEFYINSKKMTINDKQVADKIHKKYLAIHDDIYAPFGEGGFLKLTFENNGFFFSNQGWGNGYTPPIPPTPPTQLSVNDKKKLDIKGQEIIQKADALSIAIDNCKCKSKDPLWVKWAKARLEAQPALVSVNRDNSHGLGLMENEISIIENQFERLKKQKGNSDCQGCPPGNGQKNYAYSANENYFTPPTPPTPPTAPIPPTPPTPPTDKNARHTQELVKMMVRDGFVKVGQKTTFKFDGDNLTIDGKNMDNATFERYKKAFEAKVGQKTKYSIWFKGVVNSIQDGKYSMNGSFSTHFDEED